MAWDFSIEPEFQEKLDWVARFCREEVEPLELVFPGAAYRALHIMGSLGTTDLTPLQRMWAESPVMAIADGVDEVHKATVARNVLKGYQPNEGLWPTEYLPGKRELARKKYAHLIATDPDLAAWASAAGPASAGPASAAGPAGAVGPASPAGTAAGS